MTVHSWQSPTFVLSFPNRHSEPFDCEDTVRTNIHAVRCISLQEDFWQLLHTSDKQHNQREQGMSIPTQPRTPQKDSVIRVTLTTPSPTSTIWTRIMCVKQNKTRYLGRSFCGTERPRMRAHAPCRALYSLSTMTRARPKSATLTVLLGPTSTFLAARSRWMYFSRSRYAMPSAICQSQPVTSGKRLGAPHKGDAAGSASRIWFSTHAIPSVVCRQIEREPRRERDRAGESE